MSGVALALLNEKKFRSPSVMKGTFLYLSVLMHEAQSLQIHPRYPMAQQVWFLRISYLHRPVAVMASVCS